VGSGTMPTPSQYASPGRALLRTMAYHGCAAELASNPSFSAPGRLRARTWRGGRAVECGGLENRFSSLGGTRVQIPPPPLNQAKSGTAKPFFAWFDQRCLAGRAVRRSPSVAVVLMRERRAYGRAHSGDGSHRGDPQVRRYCNCKRRNAAVGGTIQVQSPFLITSDVAARLRCSVRTIREMTRLGVIPHRRLPGSRRCLFRGMNSTNGSAARASRRFGSGATG
jgi:hypothetical protein